MMRNICIVHYNTPELTTATVQSIRKHTPGCAITIFDNSDKRPFPQMEGVSIIDNTKGQLVDFDAMIARYPDKIPTATKWGSEKHIASVEKLFDIIPEGFVLMDSDVLVKWDITPFFDESVAWVGQVEQKPRFWFQATRLFPFILWINVPMCKEKGIRFWHEGQVYKLSHRGAPYYDTAGSFYHDCLTAGLPYKEINIHQYIDHFGEGSYTWTKHWEDWLERHKHLYINMETKKQPVKKIKKDPILVVIPFKASGAQGREIEYAVAGWRKHFKEDYLIVVVGDNHPVCETGDDIMCIESERVPAIEGMYRQHLDYVSCFKKVHEAFPKSKGFIMVADDCYAVNDFDLIDVKFLKQKDSSFTGDPNSTNGWQVDKARTRRVLDEAGLPCRNFTTHLPQWYEWDKLEALWEKYDMEHVSYTMEDLYYNTYFPTRIPLQLHIDYDNLKCGVYRSNPRINYIERAFNEQIWITNSPEGWIPELDRMLANYYGI